ncbi:MAG: DUF1298 domain-containing protein [Pseudomonadales bacterium]|nr:DUF1298 domain-containing protein [Pseudomonadales bacterium]
MLSKNPRTRIKDSPLSIEAGERYRKQFARPDEQSRGYTDSELRNVAEFLQAQFNTGINMFGALKKFSGAWLSRSGPLWMPFMEVPASSINTPVDGARRFVAQSWPFERIRALGRAFDGTFNDAILAVCAGTLRLYLANHAELPSKSLKAMVPISLRKEGDLDSSNAVGFLSADLATNVNDPAERFAVIKASTHAGKQFLHDLTVNEAQLVSTLLQVPGMLLLPLGLMSKLPPYNTIISNVPGPRQPMYWNGARLAGMYPASVVTEGIALNITMVTYDKHVDFGFMACRRSLPQAQRLIDYMEEAIVELEVAAGKR